MLLLYISGKKKKQGAYTGRNQTMASRGATAGSNEEITKQIATDWENREYIEVSCSYRPVIF